MQGVQLDEAYSLSALQLALEEMPRAWAEQARQDPKTMLMKVRGEISAETL
jgi:chaperonin GroEL (HSP60 family)